jgi:3-methylcrotonyl-CoA carboxylase beta subunit
LKKLSSNIDPSSAIFQERQKFNKDLLDSLRVKLESATQGGALAAREKHQSRGKLLVRHRINLLLDPNTPFIELSPLAAYGQYNDQFPSAGIVTGIGLIHGKEVVVIANDATVKGGTYIKETIKKHLRAQEIALQNHMACVYLVDSGGIFLPNQAEVFPDKNDFGRIFYNQAQLSAEGIPQVAVVLGSCTAGGAYVPAMSDETIIVKEQGTIFLGGPPLVKAATGEEVSSEELGGAEVHTSISGVADHLADNDQDALQICRDIFETIQVPERQRLDMKPSKDPHYDLEEIYGLIPQSNRETLDVRELIARLVDGS